MSRAHPPPATIVGFPQGVETQEGALEALEDLQLTVQALCKEVRGTSPVTAFSTICTHMENVYPTILITR